MSHTKNTSKAMKPTSTTMAPFPVNAAHSVNARRATVTRTLRMWMTMKASSAG